jgi:hypothetical protein
MLTEKYIEDSNGKASGDSALDSPKSLKFLKSFERVYFNLLLF